MTKPTALVTGGAGFIGSHCCLDLILNGYNVVVIDNFINSSPAAIEQVGAHHRPGHHPPRRRSDR